MVGHLPPSENTKSNARGGGMSGLEINRAISSKKTVRFHPQKSGTMSHFFNLQLMKADLSTPKDQKPADQGKNTWRFVDHIRKKLKLGYE